MKTATVIFAALVSTTPALAGTVGDTGARACSDLRGWTLLLELDKTDHAAAINFDNQLIDSRICRFIPGKTKVRLIDRGDGLFDSYYVEGFSSSNQLTWWMPRKDVQD